MAFSRMIWKISPPTPIIGSWDYWTSVQKTIVEIRRRDDDEVVDTIYKANKKIAYYAMVNCEDSYTLIIISPIDDAVDYIELGVRKTYRGTITDANGITWYWGGFQFLENKSDYYVYPNCVMGDTVYSVNDGAQAAQDLVDRIYAIPFRNNYVLYEHYEFTSADLTDHEKMLRKAFGAYLFLNISLYDTNAYYRDLSDNVDDIISNSLTGVANDPLIYAYIRLRRIFIAGAGNRTNVSGGIDTAGKFNGYEARRINFDQTLQGNEVVIDIDGTGTPRYTYTTSGDWYVGYIGLMANIDSYPDYSYVNMLNLGIDL